MFKDVRYRRYLAEINMGITGGSGSGGAPVRVTSHESQRLEERSMKALQCVGGIIMQHRPRLRNRGRTRWDKLDGVLVPERHQTECHMDG